MGSYKLSLEILTRGECEGLFKSAVARRANFLQSLEMCQRYREIGQEMYVLAVRRAAAEDAAAAGTAAGAREAGARPRAGGGEDACGPASDAGGVGDFVAYGVVTARKWKFGKKIFRVAGGWVMDYDAPEAPEIIEFLTKMSIKFVRAHQGMMLEISPNIEANEQLSTYFKDYKYLGEYGAAKWIYVLNLAGKTKDDVWDGMRQSHRRMLRKAEKSGVIVRELKDTELPEMQKIMSETGERQGFHEQNIEYYRSAKKAFGEKVKLMGAFKADEIVAVGMFVNYGGEMIYLYGGSRRETQKYGGSYALQWEMIQEAIKTGAKRYNFYGTRPVEGNGVYQFKQGFRGEIQELIGTFVKPTSLMGRVYVARLKPQKYGELR